MAHGSSADIDDFHRLLEAAIAGSEHADLLLEHLAASRAREVHYAFYCALLGTPNLASGRGYIPPGAVSQLYEDNRRAAPKEAAETETAEMKSDERIEAEVRKICLETLDDLRHIRRRFARENHPDAVGPAEREEANRRMAIANRLIDDALKRRVDHSST